MILLNTEDAAKILGINPASLRQAVWRHALQPVARTKNSLFFDAAEVERYREVRKQNRRLP